MAKAKHTTDARLLVGIDISKNRHEVLIGVPGKTRRRRMTVLNTADDYQRLIAVLRGFELLAMCLAMAHGWKFGREIGTPGNVLAGMVSGVANGAAVGGLPVAVFLAGQPIAARVFGGTMIAYLTLICIVALPTLWMTGLLRGSSFILLAGMVPPMALGLWIGGRRFASTSPQDFRRFILGVLGILSLPGLLRSTW